jgi:NAD-dependent dihydropyrimidine dehydrogenase PreA subunit
MATYLISNENLTNLLGTLQNDYSVFVPNKINENRSFTGFQNSDDSRFVVGEVRTVEPLKIFYLRSRERVAEGFGDEVPQTRGKPYCIVGAKACDLKGFKVQDRVFKEDEYTDPFYMRDREENLIISADCTCAIDTCYCLALHVEPWPQTDFDINLSEVSGGYVVESGSPKGEKVITENQSLFTEASKEQLASRDEQRKRVTADVKKNVKANAIPDQDRLEGAVEKNYGAPLWQEEAAECVECGACNMICPTCHCFLMYDQGDEKRMARLRVWDSCMVKDFARVAGGANPRPDLWKRLRNRFEKKFDFFPKISGIYACTGCGRCITACPAKIDIRKVLKRLVENV